jgi:hypothetical protein
MKERPVLFSGPMVRAILEGRKTQTRRVADLSAFNVRVVGGRAKGFLPGCPQGWDIACPYGKAGDRLWVRETWAFGCAEAAAEEDRLAVYRADLDESPRATDAALRRQYPALCAHYKFNRWRPSIHMPRWASRFTLEITDVRVQRLQDTSADDIVAEGVKYPVTSRGCVDGMVRPLIQISGDHHPGNYLRSLKKGGRPWTHEELLKAHWASRWDAIYAKRGSGWGTNPWVWAISFRRIDAR